MTPPPVPSPAPADPATHSVPDRPTAPTDGEEPADLFRWMSWSAAIAMNA